MTYEGRHRSSDIGRGERLAEVVYAVLRDEWSELRGPLPSIGATTPKYDTTAHAECRRMATPRSLSEKQCSKRYASLVECKDAIYSTTKSRLL